MGGAIALLVIGIAIAGGLLGYRSYRRKTAPKNPRKRESSSKAEQWGVRIAAEKEKTCPPVRSFLGREYPMAERPRLPLADCPYPHRCECRYVPLMDRRKAQRRLGVDRRGAQRFETERRSGKDRRKDLDWEARDRKERE